MARHEYDSPRASVWVHLRASQYQDPRAIGRHRDWPRGDKQPRFTDRRAWPTCQQNAARRAAVMLGVLAVGVTTGLVLKDRSVRKPAWGGKPGRWQGPRP